MRNVTMIRTEPGLVSVPIEIAVFCENCENVSQPDGDVEYAVQIRLSNWHPSSPILGTQSRHRQRPCPRNEYGNRHLSHLSMSDSAIFYELKRRSRRRFAKLSLTPSRAVQFWTWQNGPT